VLKIDILGKVSSSLPRSSVDVTVRDFNELKELYGPTLFPLIRSSHTDAALANTPKRRGLDMNSE
jgi:hypothetical protein